MKKETIIIMLLIFVGCTQTSIKEEPADDLEGIPYGSAIIWEYPPYYTPTEQYFEYFSNGVPFVERESYRLKIHGELDYPVELTLDELEKLPMIEQPQTVECIGNIATGNLIGTAKWAGFSLVYLLDSVGMDPAATNIKFVCADGYYSTTSIEVLKSRNVLGALFMNNEPIPLKYGYPLRIMNPGFYGVKNPGWVTEIEILNQEANDYWDSDGWKTSETMKPDTKIFFPSLETRWSIGDTIKIGGAAFGSRRIVSVDVSFNNGISWQQAEIVKNSEEDYVWIFWMAKFVPEEKGDYSVLARATDENGNRQPRTDDTYLDGNNSMPEIYLYVR